MRRIPAIGLCITLLCAAGAARAVDGTGAAIVDRGEEWLGEGSDLGLELAHVIAAGKKGNAGQARRDLEMIAAEAESRGLKGVWIQAQQAWIRFTLTDQPEADLTPAVEEILRRAQDWKMAAEEAEIYALWADVLTRQGQWLMAVKAQDRTTQLALEAGRVARALEAFLEMARLCRGAGHGWRLQQVWVRIDQVRSTRPVELSEALAEALKKERTAGAALLAQAGLSGRAVDAVDLQPKDSRVLVSSTDREMARSRFLLTNTSAFPVDGTLDISAAHAGVASWQMGSGALYVTLDPSGSAASSQPMHLLPGQQREVYVERGPGVAEESVSVVWQGGSGKATASGTFYFTEGLPMASVVNAGVFQLHAGWCIPLYHEIYHRGPRAQVGNLAVAANAPCRLEVFDYDTGRLLAVDAEGDGAYSGAGDEVLADEDRDGWPDLVIGDRARAIEICAWPLSGNTGTGITVRAGLRARSGQTAPARAAENSVTGFPGGSVSP